MEKLAQDGQLVAYRHDGYWQCMDTKREKDKLEELWGAKPVHLKLGGANIFILDVSGDPKAFTPPSHPHQGLDHFGLEVKNIDAVVESLKAKGAVFTRGPETIRPGTRIAFLTGPEGVSIELLERTPV